MNYGKELLRIERMSQREKFLDNKGNIRIRRDSIFDEEKERIMHIISLENKRKIAKELETNIKKLPKEKC